MPLQMMEHNSHNQDQKVLTSHGLANELRELYDLPPLNGEISTDIIINLGGLLKEYVDSVESLVDVSKTVEKIYLDSNVWFSFLLKGNQESNKDSIEYENTSRYHFK